MRKVSKIILSRYWSNHLSYKIYLQVCLANSGVTFRLHLHVFCILSRITLTPILRWSFLPISSLSCLTIVAYYSSQFLWIQVVLIASLFSRYLFLDCAVVSLFCFIRGVIRYFSVRCISVVSFYTMQ